LKRELSVEQGDDVQEERETEVGKSNWLDILMSFD
jgi:hypothetical protein